MCLCECVSVVLVCVWVSGLLMGELCVCVSV